MKVVLDTNVFIAALRSRQGASNALLQLLFKKRGFTHCVSVASVLELEAVLFRDEHREATRSFRRKTCDGLLMPYVVSVRMSNYIFAGVPA
ncbi:MAG TPA: PIN domain-containing protein [Deltaproteobacteria bacterium]|nr:PIN domain-containing protein [Deltaproteobacteria bacterium]